MKKIDIVLGSGLEGYGVVKFAFDIAKKTLQEGYDTVVCKDFGTQKYFRPDTFELPKGVVFSEPRLSSTKIVVSLPVSESTALEFSNKIKEDQCVMFVVNRNKESLSNNIDLLSKYFDLLKVRGWLSFDTWLKDNYDFIDDSNFSVSNAQIANQIVGSYRDRKTKSITFVGRATNYKNFFNSISTFAELSRSGWSYYHLSDVSNEEVLRVVKHTKYGYYGSVGDNGDPIIENTLLDFIMNGVIIVTPNSSYRRRLCDSMGVSRATDKIVCYEQVDFDYQPVEEKFQEYVLDMNSSDKLFNSLKRFM